MTNEQSFLASYNNIYNDYANIIEVNSNVILGFIGRFGYGVFEIGSDGYFSNVTDFTTLENAQLDFNSRKDNTGTLSLKEKINLIQDKNLANLIIDCVLKLKYQTKSFEKWISINASVNLGKLSKMTLTQLINEAKLIFTN
jgi:hypothetical protein